jgi:hypothetical protein
MTSRRWLWGPAIVGLLISCGGHADFTLGVDNPDATANGGEGGAPPGADGSTTTADGSARLDGETSGDGAIAADGAACFESDGGVRPTAKGCTNPQSCAITIHGGCCGPQYADGINHAFVKDYTACEAADSLACGARGCVSGPIYDEDGKTGKGGTLQVTCDNNICRARYN